MSDSPEIAVVLGAYHRTDYLLKALGSLADQTLPRDRFEVVAIKNFRHPEIDRALEAFGATILFDEEPQIGRWLRHAVNRSTAPIVTFLDDDDEFEPERLERVAAVWRAHPDLGFYRNRVSVIDGAGRAVPAERWRVHETDAGFDLLGPVLVRADGKAGLVDLATRRTTSTFNTSSMAIRRELLHGELGDAFEGTQLEDSFLFLAGVLSPFAMFLDDRRLTRFRYYGGNVSSTVRWLSQAADSHRAMSALAARRGNAEFAGFHAREEVHYTRMSLGATLIGRIRDGGARREVARLTTEYLRFLGQHSQERTASADVWAAGVYGLAYPVLPFVTRRIANSRPTSWRSAPSSGS
ncbi:MAG: glycosyltransferase family A protein [Thermoplasmata archaeon]